ncbi:hypothetical protein P4O66_021726 [Electrophorus voltai]|uniref:WAP, follistatin/kazal, immunoglobulin, kunitz and netrin domain containing 1 n=1 Tax=Electrophorus voltai TaxID=2609070 RepID=A0AAD8ZQ29_9TELE|nr:hypothetical protein P4O66_021726 [Electrophorus voltai]
MTLAGSWTFCLGKPTVPCPCCLSLLLWVLAAVSPPRALCASVAGSRRAEHPGVCPDKLNANLWVDAQSTCDRECEKDTDCADFEKCCANVCGLLSCVASRFPDGTLALPDGQSSASVSSGGASSCDGFLCNQQGAVCDVWEGQPVCKCQDGCESEPSFTCASDGLTYFNRCYMDAEACIQGVTLSVVTCRYHLSGLWTSPLPPDTTAQPTPTSSAPFPPTLYSSPQHQAVYLGGTVSFHCDAIGHPKPDVTWEKQSERRERLVMRPDQMYGNVVITTIGQLVVYNAQTWDTGIYTCIARNSAGELHADFPLSVVRRAEREFYEEQEGGGEDEEAEVQPFSPADCLAPLERGECGESHVDWYYNTTLGLCQPFAHSGCPVGRNRFETYEECRALCQLEGPGVCSLPAVQGPCRNWEVRWAYNAPSRHCQPFIYGGCHGNSNSFRSRAECEEACPRQRARPCRGCRPRARLVPSLCSSDFAIVGRLAELLEEPDSGVARFRLERVLRDEKMGLELFKAQHLEVTLARIDWSCPCPNITLQDERPLLVMGEVQDGMAVVLPDSYVRLASERKVRKIQEVLAKRTCEMLQRFQD